MLRLFYRPKDESYYFIPEDRLTCVLCKKEIIISVIFEFNWGKKKSDIQTYCIDCIPKMKKSRERTQVRERILTILTESIPKDSYPILIKPPNLVDARDSTTVFEAAEMNFRREDGVVVNDRTIHAGRHPDRVDMLEFRNARMKELGSRLKELHTPLRIEQANDYLKMLKQAKPVLPESAEPEMKLLGTSEKPKSLKK